MNSSDNLVLDVSIDIDLDVEGGNLSLDGGDIRINPSSILEWSKYLSSFLKEKSEKIYKNNQDDKVNIKDICFNNVDYTIDKVTLNITAQDGYGPVSLTVADGADAGYIRSAEVLNNKINGSDGDDTISVSTIAAGSGALDNECFTDHQVHGYMHGSARIDNNQAYGGSGNDAIKFSAHGEACGDGHVVTNKVYGEDGDDTITLIAQGGSSESSHVQNNYVYGGNGDDFITLTASSDQGFGYVEGNIIYGGEGKDTFAFIGRGREFDAGDEAVNTIADFSVEEGDLILMPEKGSASNFRTAEQDIATFEMAYTQAGTVVDSDTVKYFFAPVGEDGYLFYDLDGSAGAENVIKLAGVTTFEFGSIDALVA